MQAMVGIRFWVEQIKIVNKYVALTMHRELFQVL